MKVTYLGLPRRERNVEIRREPTRNVVLDHARCRVHVLNDSALALFELCDGKTTPGEMIDSVCALFSRPRDVIATDVERLLAELTRAELIEWLVRDPAAVS